MNLIIFYNDVRVKLYNNVIMYKANKNGRLNVDCEVSGTLFKWEYEGNWDRLISYKSE